MRLVKIRLADCPFWFLHKMICLTKQVPLSDFVNVDSLPDEDKRIINNSISRGEIRVFDPENRRLKTINEADYISGEHAVDIEDIEDDESDSVPEVFSVTMNNDEEELKEGPTEADYENAQLLLNKNGNTVKKTIKEIPKTSEGLFLLQACLEFEKENKNRTGIVNIIEQCVMES